MKRAFNLLGGFFVILMIGSLFLALSHSEGLRDAPKSPNAVTGQIFPVSVKGVGTVYIDEKEWKSIAPYWNSFFVFLGLIVTLIVGRIVFAGYRAFMKGWRSGESKE